jgi:acyl-coenzyme A thioesterase PaaI-like protein
MLPREVSPALVRRLINLWPPLRFAGVRVRAVAADWRRVDVELRLRWWNRNAVGVMFGGSLFSMTDPFYPLMLQHHLGPGYAVWTKSAEIDFLAPGRRIARASFRLSEEEVAQIKAGSEGGDKLLAPFLTEILDQNDEIIARVRTLIHVRQKKAPQVRNASGGEGWV